MIQITLEQLLAVKSTLGKATHPEVAVVEVPVSDLLPNLKEVHVPVKDFNTPDGTKEYRWVLQCEVLM